MLLHSLQRNQRKRKGKNQHKQKKRPRRSPRRINRDDLPATDQSYTNIVLSRRNIEKLHEWAYNYAGLIYMVKAEIKRRGDPVEEIPTEYKYKGRYYKGRGNEDLQTEWMDKNGMDYAWRQATILRNLGSWYRVPVCASTKPSSDKPSCIADCLIKFFDHVGLTRNSEKFKEVRNINPQWKRCRTIIKKFRQFDCQSRDNIDPLRSILSDNVLYLFQLGSVNINTKAVDNSHAICVFNGLIYDANIDNPLPVNGRNLDACCVGGTSWVFDKAVRSATFTPNTRVVNFIRKHFRAIK